MNEKGYAEYYPDLGYLNDMLTGSQQTGKNNQHLQGLQQMPSNGTLNQRSIRSNNQNAYQRGGSVSCFGGQSSTQTFRSTLQQFGNNLSNDQVLLPGEISIEGDLQKIGRKTEMWLKRHYILQDSALLCYSDRNSRVPKSK